MKNKTVAVWLTLFGGALGLQRWYLLGRYDRWGVLLLLPTLLGSYGVWRVRQWGVDDQLSWLLMPLLGFTLAGCAMQAIYYGLMDADKWNRRFNPTLATDTPAGQANWLTILGVATSLLLGTTVLMASIAFSFQRYFEYQLEQTQSSVLIIPFSLPFTG
jgi:hypothetical protein